MKAKMMGDNIPVYKDTNEKGNWVTRLSWDSEVRVVNILEKEGRKWLKVKLPDGQEGYIAGDVPMSMEYSLDQLKADFYEEPGEPFDPPRRRQKGDRFFLQTGTVEHEGKKWLRLIDRRVIKGYLSADTKLDSSEVESEEASPLEQLKTRLLKGRLGGGVLMAMGALMVLFSMFSTGFGAVYLIIALIFLVAGLAAIYRSMKMDSSAQEGAKK